MMINLLKKVLRLLSIVILPTYKRKIKAKINEDENNSRNTVIVKPAGNDWEGSHFYDPTVNTYEEQDF